MNERLRCVWLEIEESLMSYMFVTGKAGCEKIIGCNYLFKCFLFLRVLLVILVQTYIQLKRTIGQGQSSFSDICPFAKVAGRLPCMAQDLHRSYIQSIVSRHKQR